MSGSIPTSATATATRSIPASSSLSASPKLTPNQMIFVFEILKAGGNVRDYLNKKGLEKVKIKDLIVGQTKEDTHELRAKYVKCHEIGLRFKKALDNIRYQDQTKHDIVNEFIFPNYKKFTLPCKKHLNEHQHNAIKQAIEDSKIIKATAKALLRTDDSRDRTTWELMKGCSTSKTALRERASELFSKFDKKNPELTFAQYDFVRLVISANEYDINEILPPNVIDSSTNEGLTDIRNLFSVDQNEHFRRWLGQSGKGEVVTRNGELMYRYKNHGFIRLINESYCYEPLEKADPDEVNFIKKQQAIGFDPRSIHSPLMKEVHREGSLAEGRKLFLMTKDLQSNEKLEYLIDAKHGRVLFREKGKKDPKSIKQIIFTKNNLPIKSAEELKTHFESLPKTPELDSSAKESEKNLTPVRESSSLGKDAIELFREAKECNYVSGDHESYEYYVFENRIIFIDWTKVLNRAAAPPEELKNHIRQVTIFGTPQKAIESIFKGLINNGDFKDGKQSYVVEVNGDECDIEKFNDFHPQTIDKNYDKFGFIPDDRDSAKLFFAKSLRQGGKFDVIADHICLFADGGRVLFAPKNQKEAIKKGDYSKIKMYVLSKPDGSYEKDKEQLKKAAGVVLRASKSQKFKNDVGERYQFELNLNTGRCLCGTGDSLHTIDNIYSEKYIKN